MADPEENIDSFIAEVEAYPEIWNAANEKYHDRSAKRTAWLNICTAFYEGFQEMSDMDKNQICNKMVQKWRNIKDSYMKSLKKKRKYIYSQKLSFLQYGGNRASLDGNDDEEDVEDEAMIPLVIQSSPREASEAPHFSEYPTRKRSYDVDSVFIELMHMHAAAVFQPNSDRAFFESLLPLIKDFTEDQKIEFRVNVLNIIKEMRKSVLDEPPRKK